VRDPPSQALVCSVKMHSPAFSNTRYVCACARLLWTLSRSETLRALPPSSVSLAAVGLLVHGGRLGLSKLHEGYFGSILFGVVDVLAVVPVASSDVLTLDGHSAGPGGTTSWGAEC
jgi:hypothetical protein